MTKTNTLQKSAQQRDKGDMKLIGGVMSANQPHTALINEAKYSIKEAAKMMRIGDTTLRSIIKHGGIAVLKIGGKYLLLERDIEQYLHGKYITIQETDTPQTKLLPLPDHISKSDLLRRTG